MEAACVPLDQVSQLQYGGLHHPSLTCLLQIVRGLASVSLRIHSCSSASWLGHK